MSVNDLLILLNSLEFVYGNKPGKQITRVQTADTTRKHIPFPSSHDCQSSGTSYHEAITASQFNVKNI